MFIISVLKEKLQFINMYIHTHMNKQRFNYTDNKKKEIII